MPSRSGSAAPEADSVPETGVVLPELDGFSVADTVAFAVAAERAGFESIWCSEGWGYAPFALLGRISEVTDCWLGTGIAHAFGRTPAAMATNALTLHEATGGRFVLGLGTSSPSVVKGFHGVDFDRPVRRVRETIEVVRLALAGEPIDYDGSAFDADGYVLDHVGDGVDVPIFNAALGPTNVAMTVDYADGIVTYLLPFDSIPSAIAAGRARAGNDADVHITSQIPTCVSHDAEKARTVLADHLAYYVGALDAYHGVVFRHGYPDVADQIRTAWRAGEHDRARRAVTDALLDAVGIVGTPERARDRYERILDGPVDTAVITFPAGVDEEMRHAALDALRR